MEFKTCTNCEKTKPITEFYKSSNYQGGYMTHCKKCKREYQRNYNKTKGKKETKEKRHQRYIKESLTDGARYRVGLKYVLDMPTENHQKCTKCGKWKILECFRIEKKYKHRSIYRRTTCNECGRKPKKSRNPENYPLLCSICGRRFAKKEHLSNHRTRIHGIKLYGEIRLPRKRKSFKEIKNDDKIRSFLNTYLGGNGCCLYCGEIDFWKLNNHHPWKRRKKTFTITLCENHHTLFTRSVPFLLEGWY